MRVRNHTLMVSIILLCMLSYGCAKDPQPSTAEVEAAVTARLPSFVRLSNFSIDASQNEGTKVEPHWHSRFRANATLLFDTFYRDGSEDGVDNRVTFVRPAKKNGDVIELFGKSQSRLYAGTWRTQVEIEGLSADVFGLPASAMGAGVIVRGSKEEAAFREEMTRQVARAAAAREQAAKEELLARERVKQEAENKRQAMLQAFESADCSEGEYELPKLSTITFVVSPKRDCWTPWVLVEYPSWQLTGNVLVEAVRRDGTVLKAEDGPNTTFKGIYARSLTKIHFKSLRKEPVTLTLKAE
jgi:hypothetical protein